MIGARMDERGHPAGKPGPRTGTTPRVRAPSKALGRLVPVAALAVFAALAGLFKIKSYDVFWHLATGRWIAAHGQIPRSDPFRFTSHGAPWVDHEWLFQVLLHGAERLAGLDGLIVLRSVAAVALAALLLVTVRRSGAPTPWAVVAVLAAVLGARPRLFLRPELVTLLALGLLLLLLQELRRAGGRRRIVLAAEIVVLAVPWANAHPGSLAAPVVAGAFLLGCRLPGGRPGRRGGAEPMPWALVFGLPAALALALLATPNGWHILAVPAAIGSSLHDLAGINPEWLPLWNPAIAHDSVYLFVAAAALVLLAAAALRRAHRLDPATGLAALALATLASSSIRHQALFYVGAVPFAGECLADLARTAGIGRAAEAPHPAADASTASGRRMALLSVVLCAVAAGWVLAPPTRGPLAPLQGRYHPGLGLEPARFPVALADRIGDWPGLGPLYNNVAWGGYLLWRLYPPRQIFVDGRNEVDPGLLREIAAARRSSPAWHALLERYGVDGAVVRYDERRLQVLDPPLHPGGEPVVSWHTPHAVLFPREEFALVAWDDTGMLLVRRTAGRTARLAAEEYRFVHPEDWQATLERAAGDQELRDEVLAEVERRLAEGPPCRRAAELRDALRKLAEEQAPAPAP